MAYKDVLAVLWSSIAEASVIAAASQLAQENKGSATALLVGIEPAAIYVPDGYMAGEVWEEISARVREGFTDEEGKLKARLKREPVAWSVRSLAARLALIGASVTAAARTRDVILFGRPTDDAHAHVLESVLFGSGRPLIVVPPNWEGGRIGRNIVIGWNAKREAARALADARPLIERADKVSLVAVGAKPDDAGRGEALAAAHLARAGIEVESCNVDARGRAESTVLIDECRARGADLLVIGGYGHARLAEFVFGGVSRDLLRAAPLPLLIAH